MKNRPIPNKQQNSPQRLQQALRLHQEGQCDQAALHCAAILAAQPNHFDAMHLLGIVRLRQGRSAEARDRIQAALKVNPRSAEALANLGIAFGNLDRPAEAVASYDKALALRPNYPEALYNRGAALYALKRPTEALASYDKALELRPGYPEALYSSGVALYALNRPGEALARYDKTLALRPNDAGTLYHRGNALHALKRSEEAVASYDIAIAIRPDYPEAFYNRGVALQDLRRSEEALASYDRALALRPDYIPALRNRGIALRDLKRPREAIANYNKALALRPDDAESLLNRGMNALLTGDFAAGWRDYESRWDVENAPARKLLAPYPVWKGEDVRGKRIIIYEEQGLGDVIQISRFLKPVAAMEANVTFLVRASMHRLLRALVPSVRLTDKAPDDEAFDFQCALMSAPGALGTSHQNLPSDVPYLFAEEALAARWAQRLGTGGLKIGVCWQGRVDVRSAADRSFPARRLAPLAAIPGVRLISLQKAQGLDQLDDLPTDMKIETPGAEFDDGPDAFVDTAAVMACLDLVVTTDTSIAHLAGALGRPVWVALKHVPDWRWMLDRSDSPWYPTMKLYRQEIRDNWDNVFERMAADVAALGSSGAG